LIVVDCTAADSFGPLYKGLLEAKIPIVSANKHVQSGPLEILDGINEHLTGASSVSWRYETSVGAALPIISTLNALVVTGDRIQTIECTLSGSLAFIFDTMQKGALFSEALKQADQLGYLEPDPREDLGGGDFQRKLLILSRLMGICSEMADIDVEPLLPLDVVPARIQSINEPYEAFLGALPELDTYFEQKIRQLASRGKVLRVIGRIDGTSGRATIRLEAVDSKSPFYPLSGSQNMVAFTTDRYIEQPLVIMGPGAGPEITASGVLNDIIETVREIKD
jgi:aspartokinase/homoserine dehydrogenase 1